MNENKALNKNNFSSIMKAIQNEIKDIIIDKYISTIMTLNLEIIILKDKYSIIEKLANKSLKKLMLIERSPKKKIKKHVNSPIKQDLNSSNDLMLNSTQIKSIKDTTTISELDSTVLTANFSPKTQKIECKRIIFKKQDPNKNKKKQIYSKSSHSKQTMSYIKTNKNSSQINKKKKINSMNSDYMINSYANSEKKVNKNNSQVKSNLDITDNYLNDSKKENLNEPFIKRRERSSSVKSINLNETSMITNSFDYDGKNKKHLEYNNSKILHDYTKKNNYLNNSSIIGQKIRHIKIISNMGNKNNQNQNNSLKKNFSQGGNVSLRKNNFTKSPQPTGNDNLSEFKNTSIVKISLAPENFNNNSLISNKNILTKYQDII